MGDVTRGTVNLYPRLVRNQGHDYHDYTVQLSDSVHARLTEGQVQSLWRQIVLDQSGLTAEEVAAMRADLAEIRANEPSLREILDA